MRSKPRLRQRTAKSRKLATRRHAAAMIVHARVIAQAKSIIGARQDEPLHDAVIRVVRESDQDHDRTDRMLRETRLALGASTGETAAEAALRVIRTLSEAERRLRLLEGGAPEYPRGEVKPPDLRPQCAAAGIVPRAVIADDRGAPGVVLEVGEDGTFPVAFTRGRLRTCTLGEPIEILAGPGEWHAARLVVLEEWQRRPADWPQGYDAQSTGYLMTAWRMLAELAEQRGFVLGEDLVVHFMASRPRVRVPGILRLTAGEEWDLATKAADGEPLPWRVPYQRDRLIHPPVVEDARRGAVSWHCDEDGVGPASLRRDGLAERLFLGAWVTREEAHAYADAYGHEFGEG